MANVRTKLNSTDSIYNFIKTNLKKANVRTWLDSTDNIQNLLEMAYNWFEDVNERT